MIHDAIERADRYARLHPRIAQAFHFLETLDAGLPGGRHPIDDDNLFAIVSDSTTKPLSEGRWEAHARYIDLQFLVTGEERFGVAIAGALRAEPLDEAKDLQWLLPPDDPGAAAFLTLRAGQFVLLWPGEGHMPGIAVGSPLPTRKVVVKILMDEM